ncbi:hypothetical protein IT084_07875 [Desulfallas sp. Bu1-1]|uniref:hypothetical protein n=1 Tax=Desulfallas sp. Bu1-1 TaxID=2787620 RepID=UPI00189D78BE|nr:hypothetical protein [Desulfallas sp. Bu1-1]MBF7082890.1 hypothetical protein [Desulfallas sp. Bu1-1]
MKLERENNERNEQANRQLNELYKKYPELLLQEQEFTARKSCFTPSTRCGKTAGRGYFKRGSGGRRKRRVLEQIESLENKERF